MIRKTAFLLIIACAVAAAFLVSRKPGGAGRPLRGCDLANHPAYSKYDFGKGGVIDIGVQPAAAVIGPLSECLKRDRTLERALSGLGFSLRFHRFGKGPDVNFFLKRGDVEVTFGGDMPVISAAAESQVVVPSVLGRLYNSIVARRHMMVGNLKGRRIGFSFGTNAHYTLMRALAFAGLKEDEVELIEMKMTEMPDALNEGKIEAFSACETVPTAALSRFKDQVAIHKTEIVGFLYVSRPFRDKHPEAVRHILAAQLRAYRWMQDEGNLKKACGWALEAAKDFTGGPPALSLNKYMALNHSGMEAASSFPVASDNDLETNGYLHRELMFLKHIGTVPASADWDSVKASFDRAMLREVIDSPVQYSLESFDYSGDADGRQ